MHCDREFSVTAGDSLPKPRYSFTRPRRRRNGHGVVHPAAPMTAFDLAAALRRRRHARHAEQPARAHAGRAPRCRDGARGPSDVDRGARLPWSAWLTTLWREAGDAQAIVPAARLLAPVEAGFLWHRLVAADGIVRAAAARSARAQPALAADAWALVHAWGAGGESWRAWAVPRRGTLTIPIRRCLRRWAEQYRRELERLGAVDLRIVPDILAQVAHAVPDWRGRDVVLAGFIETSPQQQRLSDALAAAGMSIRSRCPRLRERRLPMRFSAATHVATNCARRSFGRAGKPKRRPRAASASRSRISRSAATKCARLAEDVLCPALQLPGNAAAPRALRPLAGDAACRYADRRVGARPHDARAGPVARRGSRVAALAVLSGTVAGARAMRARMARREPRTGSLGRRARESRPFRRCAWRRAGAPRARARGGRRRSRRGNGRAIGAASSSVAAGRGAKSLTATEFAARNAWEELLEEFARIGTLDTRMTGATALSAVQSAGTPQHFPAEDAACRDFDPGHPGSGGLAVRCAVGCRIVGAALAARAAAERLPAHRLAARSQRPALERRARARPCARAHDDAGAGRATASS